MLARSVDADRELACRRWRHRRVLRREGRRIGRDGADRPYANLRPARSRTPGEGGLVRRDQGLDRRRGLQGVPHLSYVGDASVGKDVNIGAATVTANYDGYTKHRTVIEDDGGSARIRC